MHNSPLQAYDIVNKNTMSGREIEASVLTKASLKLTDCIKNWDAGNQITKLEEALKFNQRIWSIFQAELGKKDNPLPNELKVNLLRLSKFVDRRIFETMADPSPDKLNIIIEINNSIAAGLRTSPVTDHTPKSKDTPYSYAI
jgi:flagellar protein FlaF